MESKEMRDMNECLKRYIPDDSWVEVLSRLPVKSLIRFRCVSRSWLAMIDHPDFTRLHLTRFNREDYLFVVQEFGNMCRGECIIRCSKTFAAISKIATLQTYLTPSCNVVGADCSLLNFYGIGRWLVASSIDGLFMLRSWGVNHDQFLLMWNPSIKKARRVSPIPGVSKQKMIREVCLGFDPLEKDYKYVRSIEAGDCLEFIAVYSVGTDSWKSIDFRGQGCSSLYPLDVSCPDETPNVCLQGVVYAIRRLVDRSMDLFSFDLTTDKLNTSYLPDDFNNLYGFWKLTIVNGGSSLAVVRLVENEGCIWVSQTQRTQGDDTPLKWTKQCMFSCMIPEYMVVLDKWPQFLYLKENGELLLSWGTICTSYNIETRETKVILGSPLTRGCIREYIESLILLK